MSRCQFRQTGPRLGAALAALIATGLLASSPALASSGRPAIGKVYKCYSDSTGLLEFVQALELKSSSVYLAAPSYKGNHLVGGTAKGRYRERGRKIRWLSGPFTEFTSVFHPAKHSFIALLYQGLDTEDCYLR
jgi:hypothetical protein